MRLLVADDDPSLRLALRLVLEDAGHEVVEADSVHEARAILDAGELDFALIDAGMSQEGVGLWDELERDARFRGRALLLTGDLMTLGMLQEHERVVGKPFDFAWLLSRIEREGPLGGNVDETGEDPPPDMVASS